jgi:hypothetical protein
MTSCSSESPVATNTLPDFTVIGEADGVFYEMSFNASTKETTLINLTEELDMRFSNLLDISFTDNIVSFYDISPDGFNAWQKNLNTGAYRKYEAYFKNTAQQRAIWNVHSPKHIYVGYESPVNSGQVYMKILDRESEAVNDVFLVTETRASLVGRPMYHNGKLLISYNNEGLYKTIIFNTLNQSIDKIIEYNGAPNIIKNTNGNLSVFDTNNSYFEYDLVALNKFNGRTLANTPAFLSFGNLDDPLVHNDKVYHQLPAAQPNFLNFYPGIFDLNAQKSDLIDVNQGTTVSFEPLQGTRFIPLTSVYDITNNVYLVGFTADYTEGSKGIMIFDRNKKLTNAIEAPFSPIKIVFD